EVGDVNRPIASDAAGVHQKGSARDAGVVQSAQVRAGRPIEDSHVGSCAGDIGVADEVDVAVSEGEAAFVVAGSEVRSPAFSWGEPTAAAAEGRRRGHAEGNRTPRDDGRETSQPAED